MMKVEIQAYWGAKIKIMESIREGLSPEKFLRKRSHIVVCAIVIDGKVRGNVIWDGRYLNILHEEQGAFKVEEEQ